MQQTIAQEQKEQVAKQKLSMLYKDYIDDMRQRQEMEAYVGQYPVPSFEQWCSSKGLDIPRASADPSDTEMAEGSK